MLRADPGYQVPVPAPGWHGEGMPKSTPDATAATPDAAGPAADASLLGRLQQDLTAAMRARDDLRMATLRLAIAGCKEAAVAGDEARVLSDDDVRAVLARGVKQRDEAAEAYRAAGQAERADREVAERDVLAAYLPAGLSDDEVAAVVDRVLTEGGFEGPRAMGAAMKAVQAALGGRADGKVVAGLVKARLTGG